MEPVLCSKYDLHDVIGGKPVDISDKNKTFLGGWVGGGVRVGGSGRRGGGGLDEGKR